MTNIERMLYWLPRISSIGFVLFLSAFALDVFTGPIGPMMLAGLIVHLIPSFVLLGAVMFAWRYDLVGVVIFLGFALFYIWSVGFDRPWSWYFGIAAPAAIVGILYLISWHQRRSRNGLTH